MPAYQHYNDTELIALLRSSDDKAFCEIYQRYWKLLFSVAANLIGSSADTEDVVQEVFTYLWKKRETLEIHYSLKYYLAAATKFQVYKFLVHLKKQKAREGFVPTAAPLTPENEWDYKSLLNSLQQNLRDLPENTQIIYYLKEEGLSNKQVADMMGISIKTVESHTTITKRRLRTGINYLFTIFFR